MNTFRLFLTLSIAVSMAGCSVNPVTGKQELSLVSAGQEVAIGQQQYGPAQQSQGGTYYIDPNVSGYVRSIGNKLAAVSDRALPYEFVVLNNPTPNAWALPGGKIAVNTGLLVHLEDESQLAAVLAHEIVHAAARHSAAQMTRGSLIGLGAQVLGSASAQGGYGDMSSALQMGAGAWMAKYGRGAELESDAFGMEYMAKAGYDPYGAVRLQETFVRLSEGRQADIISGLFASHPPSQARVNANKTKAASLPQGGVVGRDRYRRAVGQILRDAPAYEAQTEAIKALNAKDHRTALSHLDRAIKIQPREGQFWELRGHAWKMAGNLDNAEKAFSSAINKNPNYVAHHLARGVLRYEQKQYQGAQNDLLRSRQLLPTPIASFYLGEIALAGGQKQQAAGYYQEAAQAGGEVGAAAKERLATLSGQ